MYIVGTSGHIDHGKTSLIQALTGIDCDRLPEEKEREMTIDIGFARIEYPRLGTVSIVDVPGHERFIRNMVAGAWGIDLALLVVAVDDGWMPQTEDHFRVLQLLGVERMIAVLNKTDLADGDMIEYVEAEVREKIEGTRFAGADIAKVSSRTGEGIADLKELILANLQKLARAADARKPFLFVDRVFASKGYGTVVTGTLKNGSFAEDETVTVLPDNREVRVKKIESHNQELREGIPSQRTALNLSGISTEELERGKIIVRENFFTGSKEFLARIQLLDRSREIKNNLGIEVLVGTTTIRGKLILLEEYTGEQDFFMGRIKTESFWYYYPGQFFIITRPGGYRVVGGGTVILPDFASVQKKRTVRKHLPALQETGLEDLMYFTVAVNGVLPRERLASMFPQNRKLLDRAMSALEEQKKISLAGDYAVETSYFESTAEQIVQAVSGSIGLKIKEIADRADADPAFCREVMARVMENHGIIEKDGKYFSGSAITSETLPEPMKEALTDLRRRGSDGIEIDKIQDDALKKRIKDLVKLDLATSLDGNLVMERGVYEKLRDLVMALFTGHDKISVPEAKEAAGLSRKYIIPLLNRIEGEGLIKRIGDFRIKS